MGTPDQCLKHHSIVVKWVQSWEGSGHKICINKHASLKGLNLQKGRSQSAFCTYILR